MVEGAQLLQAHADHLLGGPGVEPRDQAKAIGVYSFVASAGGSIGLLLGGVLTQAISWHWIFFVNLPIAVVTGVLSLRLLQRDRGLGLARGADVPGALLIVSSLMLGVYTIVEASNYGWGSAHTLGFGAGAAFLLAAFVAREARAENPLVQRGIFRSRNLTGANLIQALMVAGMFGMFFLGALYLQRVLGFDSLEVGLASGLVNTTLQVGGAIGLAVLATMSTNRTDDLLAEGASQASALTDGFRLAFLIGAGIAFAAAAVWATCCSRLQPSPRPSRWTEPTRRPSRRSPPRRPDSRRRRTEAYSQDRDKFQQWRGLVRCRFV